MSPVLNVVGHAILNAQVSMWYVVYVYIFVHYTLMLKLLLLTKIVIKRTRW
jgi:hypothetical protein